MQLRWLALKYLLQLRKPQPLQTLAVTTAVVGTTGTAVNGTVDIVGGLTHTNVDAGTNAVTAVTNPVAGAVSLATGSMEKGSQAADLTTVVKAGVNLATGKGMSNPAEVGSSLAGARDEAGFGIPFFAGELASMRKRELPS